MSTPEAALVAVLNADASVAAQIGTRVFPIGGRQGTAYPYATYQRISTAGEPFLDGPSDLDHPRFQIDTWGDTALAALTAANAIRTAIDGVEKTGAGLTISATFQDQRGPTLDEETRKFGCSLDFFIWHERA